MDAEMSDEDLTVLTQKQLRFQQEAEVKKSITARKPTKRLRAIQAEWTRREDVRRVNRRLGPFAGKR
jgi:hypothetical protein